MRAYLDWNATTPPLDQVIDSIAEAQRDHWANPSSVHTAGRHARARMEDAREQVAALVGRPARDVFFTSGGTEANNIAIRSLSVGASLIIASRIEHPSVVRVVEALETQGTAVTWIVPQPSGEVSVASVERALGACSDPSRALICLQAANHETGVVQPVRGVLEVAHAIGARVVVDAVQAIGKLDSAEWRDADAVTVAAHKIRGPKGIGAVVAGPCTTLRPVLVGGGQEYGIRPGTLSAALAVGFGIAAEWAISASSRYDAVRTLRDRLEKNLVALGGAVNGGATRLPHVTNVSFEPLRGDEIVAGVDMEGVCVSSGSACSSGAAELSHVIAMMVGSARARSSVRASLGDMTTEEEVDFAIEAFRKVIARGRGMDEALLEVDR